MQKLFLIPAAMSLLVCGAAPALARVAHADSDIFAIDTVTSVEDAEGGLAVTAGLASIHPNPFNNSTMVSFRLAGEAHVELAVFDLLGRLVRVLEAGPRPAGNHRAVWDGFDSRGRPARSGVYFVRFDAGVKTETMMVTVAR